jgi:hypothetical protein
MCAKEDGIAFGDTAQKPMLTAEGGNAIRAWRD